MWYLAVLTLVRQGALDEATFAAKHLSSAFPDSLYIGQQAILLETMPQAVADAAFARVCRRCGHVRRTVHREYVLASYAGARAFFGIFAAFAFWILSRWPNGDSFILIVGIPVAGHGRAEVHHRHRDHRGRCALARLLRDPAKGDVPRAGRHADPLHACRHLRLKSSKLAAYLVPMNFFLMPMIGIRNQMVYDPPSFFNSVAAIFCDCCTGVVIFTLLPPPSERVEAALLRWWIERSAARSKPARPERRDEWRLRLYDRTTQLLARLPEAERAPAFERQRDLAVQLLKAGSACALQAVGRVIFCRRPSSRCRRCRLSDWL